MSFNTGTYVTNYDTQSASASCNSDGEWERRNCPIGCTRPHSWNLGCEYCRENHDAIDVNPPCQPYFDEIKKRTSSLYNDFKSVDGWIPEIGIASGDETLIRKRVIPVDTLRLTAESAMEYTVRLERELELTQNQRDVYHEMLDEEMTDDD